MKKVFFIIVALIVFYSLTNAQTCQPYITIIENDCDYEGVITRVTLEIQIYDDYDCIGQMCTRTYNIYHPFIYQTININNIPCVDFNCSSSLSIKFWARYYNDRNELICEGENCYNNLSDPYLIYIFN